LQQLIFENAWERTISQLDRQKIENTFEQTKRNTNLLLDLIPLKTATNHRGELLVTVLIHNFDEKPFDMSTVTIHLLYNKEKVATHTFHEKRLVLDENTSMPWTFIFPAYSLSGTLAIDNVSLQIAE